MSDYKHQAEIREYGALPWFVPCHIVEEAEVELPGDWILIETSLQVPHPHYGTVTVLEVPADRVTCIPETAMEEYADQMDKFSPDLI